MMKPASFNASKAAWIMIALATLVCTSWANGEMESVQRSTQLTVDEYSVCVYGHWQGTDILVEQRDCLLLINGFRVLPVAYEGWNDDQYPECTEKQLGIVSPQYEMLVKLLSNGVSVLVAPEETLYVSKGAKSELLADIRSISNSSVVIDKDSWSGFQLDWILARLIQSPLDLSKCREEAQ